MNEKLKSIKQEFFALRNGMIADTLRAAGTPYRMIFGLNVPQLAGIARTFGTDRGLAFTLWSDSGVRESRLLGCYLFGHEDFPAEKAIELIEGTGETPGVQTREEVDMLCFRLLKYLPDAQTLISRYEESENPLYKYLAEALSRHLQ